MTHEPCHADPPSAASQIPVQELRQYVAVQVLEWRGAGAVVPAWKRYRPVRDLSTPELVNQLARQIDWEGEIVLRVNEERPPIADPIEEEEWADRHPELAQDIE